MKNQAVLPKAFLSILLLASGISARAHAEVVDKKVHVRVNKICAGANVRDSGIGGLFGPKIEPFVVLSFAHYPKSTSDFVSDSEVTRASRLDAGACRTFGNQSSQSMTLSLKSYRLNASENVSAHIKVWERGVLHAASSPNDPEIMIGHPDLIKNADLCKNPRMHCFTFSDFRSPQEIVLEGDLGRAELTVQVTP